MNFSNIIKRENFDKFDFSEDFRIENYPVTIGYYMSFDLTISYDYEMYGGVDEPMYSVGTREDFEITNVCYNDELLDGNELDTAMWLIEEVLIFPWQV